MTELRWAALSEDDLPDLVGLAQACLDQDGGLPQLADERMLRRLFLSGAALGGREITGELGAAASAWVGEHASRQATWLVAPALLISAALPAEVHMSRNATNKLTHAYLASRRLRKAANPITPAASSIVEGSGTVFVSGMTPEKDCESGTVNGLPKRLRASFRSPSPTEPSPSISPASRSPGWPKLFRMMFRSARSNTPSRFGSVASSGCAKISK